MDNHFTVTIHDDNGVKQFNVHRFISKALIYGALFVVTLVLAAVGTILYLNASIEKIEDKRQEIKEAYLNIEEQNKALQSKMSSTKKSLSRKKIELEELSDSLSEIEQLIGLKPLEDSNLSERVSSTKMSSQHRAIMMQLIPNGSPIEFKGITSRYGYRMHPILKTREYHRGTDMKAQRNTPVYAPADGMVEWSGRHTASGYGRLVILAHSYGFKTYYGHLKKTVVKSGKFVKKGALIAYTGNSGRSDGPHLHYEVRFMQRVLNPLNFIKWTQKNYDEIFKKETKVPWQSLITATENLIVIQKTPIPQLSQPEQKSQEN